MKARPGLPLLVVLAVWVGTVVPASADDAAVDHRDTIARAVETAAANAVGNGDFHIWDGYVGKGVTTTSVGVPRGSIPKDWYGGPGVGATATYDVVRFPPGQTAVPGNPKRHLRIRWKTPPASKWPGESQHQPAFRFTFLEYFGINDVHRFAGRTVRFSFYARVASGEIDIVPILWHSYDASTPGIAGVKGKGYEIFEASGKPGVVAVAQGAPDPHAICRLTTKWQRFTKRITLPDTTDRSITAGHYTGVGFDLVQRCAPVLDIANVDVRCRVNTARTERRHETPGRSGGR